MPRIDFENLPDKEPVEAAVVAAPSGIDFEALPDKEVSKGLTSPERLPRWKDIKDKIPANMKDYEQGAKDAISAAATYDLDMSQAYGIQGKLKEELGEPDLWDKAQGSFKAGMGDVYVGMGNTLKWAGMDENFADVYVDFGERMRDAYIPAEDQSEFSWRKTVDPEWWATTVTRSVPFTLSLIPAAIVGAYVGTAGAGAVGLGTFGTTVLGAIGGATASRPLESAFEAAAAYETALARGDSEEDASSAADKVFASNMTLIGLDAAQFAAAFTPLKFGAGLKSSLMRRMSAGTGKLSAVAISEAGEERYQEYIQMEALGEEANFFDLDNPRLNEASTIGGIFGAGMGGTGSVWNALTKKTTEAMPEDVSKIYNDVRAQSLSGGADEAQATRDALDAVADTPEGKEHIETVLNDMKEKASMEMPVEGAPEISAPTIEELFEKLKTEDLTEEELGGLLDQFAGGREIIEEVVAEPVAEIKERLLATGMDEAEATANAALFDGFRVLAQRAGVSVDDIMERYLPEVAREEVAAPVVTEEERRAITDNPFLSDQITTEEQLADTEVLRTARERINETLVEQREEQTVSDEEMLQLGEAVRFLDEKIAAPVAEVPPVSRTEAVAEIETLEQSEWDRILEKQRKLEGLKAAIRDPLTGKIYTGWSHQAAINSAPQWKPGMGDIESGIWGRLSTAWDRETDDSGFVDSEGNFITRDEAEKSFGVLTMEDVRDARKLYQTQGGITPAAPRGRIRIAPNGINIDLFKNADQSTFVHETGHLYFRMMADLSTLPSATEELKTDFETLKTWLNYEEGQVSFTVDQQEQFARGFEAYLREGKAPSSALAEAFENFKQWLMQIYKSLRDLNVELTDEVRGVMDRMLADEGIEMAEVLEQAPVEFKVKPPKKLYRGLFEQEDGTFGFGTFNLGKGLYSTPTKSFAKKYGKVIELTPEEAFPRNPLVLQPFGDPKGAFMDWLLKESGMKNIREFNKTYPDPGEFVKERGYDGVIIGDEIVRYTDVVAEEVLEQAAPTRITNIRQLAKSLGGIDYKREHLKGELDKLKEDAPATKLIINKRGQGVTLDRLLEVAIEAGILSETATLDDVISALETNLQTAEAIQEEIAKEERVRRRAETKAYQTDELRKEFIELSVKARKAYREGKDYGAVKEARKLKNILARTRKIRLVRDYFNLTDADLKKISRKNPLLLSQYEFKLYIDDVRIKAAQLSETSLEKAMLINMIYEKDLGRVDNYRRVLGLPTIANMTVDQVRTFAAALEPFHDGDVFLSERELETVDRTDLAGIATWREAKERLAAEIGVSIEELETIKVTEWDEYKWDTSLAETNPFYKMLVTETTRKLLEADLRFHEIENELFDLARKSEKSRNRTFVERAIPQDKQIMTYLETPSEDRGPVAETMTPEQIDLANYMEQYFQIALEYLVKTKSLDRGRQNYFVHMRRSFLENVKEKGLVKAFKDMFKSYQEDEAVFNIMDEDTGNILPLEKFFQFSMQRTGGIDPTTNVTKAFLVYAQMMEKKISLDELIPKMDIYAQSITPAIYTPRGLEVDRSIKKFVNKYINNRKGRRIRWISKQGGTIDVATRGARALTTLIDLGFNIPSGVAAFVGEQATNFGMLGISGYTKGNARIKTKKGKAILKKYEAFIGRSSWENFTAPGRELTERIYDGLFGLFHEASVLANKQFLLGAITADEYNKGELTSERLAILRVEMGRLRVVPGTKSMVGSTSAGSAMMQYKTWAAPIISTLTRDIKTLVNDLAKKKTGEALTTKEAREIYRVIGLTTTALIVGAMASAEDDDETFTGQILKRVYRESMTLVQGVDPSLWLATPRLMGFMTQLGKNLKAIATLEEYKTKPGLVGVEGLQKQLTPRAFKQFDEPKKKERL